MSEQLGDKSPQIKAFLKKTFPAYDTGFCPTCQEPVQDGDFRDELSRREFKISGMCQKCQDSVFGG